jgi:hypothetical protein
MTGLTRMRVVGPAAVLAILVALALPAGALAAGATPTYTKESKQAYEQQLAKAEIVAVTFNKPVRSIRITLKDGKHVLYVYPKKGSAALEEALAAKGVPVSQLHGKHKKKSSSKHTRRYVAIAIVVILILAGVAFLLFRRRRLGQD